MSKRYYACVYGGASDCIAKEHTQKVERLGEIIAENGFSLVYGAGATGCMGAVARGVAKKGGYIMGISPYFMDNFESVFPCDNIVRVETMSERKMLMEKHADVFFVTPGGMGTLDEFFQVLTLKYLKRLDAPIIVVNTGGFYDTLNTMIDALVEKGAIGGGVYELFDVIEDVEDGKLRDILNGIKK